MKKIVAIIQARMSSTRLPGKVLLPLAGKPALYRIWERLSASKLIDEIVVATSIDPSDDPVVKFCSENNIHSFRGSLDDVLDRFNQAAIKFNADCVLRITADCPVLDPIVIDAILSSYLCGDFDCIGLSGEFPDGLDCTAINAHALKISSEKATLKSDREHVVPFMLKTENNFKLGEVELFWGLEHERWTMDEQRDYEFLSEIYDELYREDKVFLTSDILNLLSIKSELKKINSDILRNEGYLKSLLEDEK